MADGSLTAADIIRLLDLKPHPEGGHYRETFRDSNVDGKGRAASTAIYFLLARGEDADALRAANDRIGIAWMRSKSGIGMPARR